MSASLGETAVLVVDDEEGNRRLVSRALKDRYRVLEAKDAQSALEVLAGDAAIGVIVCDQMMPGQKGTDLFDEMIRRRPDLVTILFTAYTELSKVQEARDHPHVFAVMEKPVILSELVSTVDRAVERYRANRAGG